MADTTEKKTYLINVEDNLEAYAQHAADAAVEVKRLEAENKKLKDEGTATAAQIEKSNAALRAAQKEYTNAKKNVELATKANDAHKNSYEELYRRWQLAQTQLKLMGDGYTTNAKGVRVLSAEYVKQSKVVADAKASLDQFGKGIHDNRLNVGSYGEAIQEAFGGVSPAMGRAAAGVKTLNTAFKALLANPVVLIIGAIVGALAALLKAFKSSDSGGTEFAARMEQIKAILDVVRQRLIAVTEAIGHVFRGEWREAGKDMKAAFTGIGEQMKSATDAAYKYAYALDTVKDAESNYISEASKNRNKIARLEFTAQDRTKSTKERKAALKEALALGLEEVQKEQEFRKARLDAEVEYLAGKAGLRAADVLGFIEMTDEEQAAASQQLKTLRNNNEEKFDEIEKFYAAWVDADTKFYEQNKRNISRLSGFDETERKALEDRQKAITEAQLKEQKAGFEARKLAAKGNTEQLIQILQEELTAELAATALGNNQKLLLQATFNDAVQKLREEDAKKAKEKAQETAKRAAEDIEAGFEAQRIKYENDVAMLSTILDQEYGALLASAEYAQMTQMQQLLADEQYTQAKKALSELRIQQSEKERAAVADALGALSAVAGEETAVGKGFAIAQAIINTWVAASQALRDPTLPSVIAKVAAMTAIIGSGMATVRNIMKVDTSGKAAGSTSGSAASAITSAPAVRHITATPVGASTLTPSVEPAAAVAATAGGLSADAIAQAVAKLPAPVVTVEDINARAAESQKVEVKANI